jgi:hypothetical protein
MEPPLFNEARLTQLIETAVSKALSRQSTTTREHKPDVKKWLNLKELMAYDPLKRKESTFYGYVSKRLIPFKKMGKNLMFEKELIDEWLISPVGLSQSEIEEKIDNALSGKG